jgi:isoleucyl-tRNA synthetase
MQSVIELVRQLRDKHNRPVKTAIKEITVVHADEHFLEDITGRLKEFVVEECNAISVQGCSDQLKYGTLKASPNFAELGKRLGKKAAAIIKGIKELSADQILVVKEGGSIEIEGEKITGTDISISQEFEHPEGTSPDELDAAVDGGILVAADLRVDEDMLAAKTAREFVNRVQKLRKACGVKLQDTIEVFVRVQSGQVDDLLTVLEAQESYILDTVGVPIQPVDKLQGDAEGPHIFVETHSLDVMGRGTVEFEVLIFNVSMLNAERLANASLEG